MKRTNLPLENLQLNEILTKLKGYLEAQKVIAVMMNQKTPLMVNGLVQNEDENHHHTA